MAIKIWHKEKSIILTKKIGKGTIIHAPVWIGKEVTIGRNVKIQAFSFIPDGVRIGDNVFIGPHTCFNNDKYPPSGDWKETIVGEDTSIGAGAVILPGITMGKMVMVGAGAVVTKNIPDNETWIGNPARKIKRR